MNERDFDRLIDLYQKNLLTGREKQLVEDWLNSPGQDEDTEFSESDKRALKNRIVNKIGLFEKTTPVAEAKTVRLQTSRPLILKIAASFALVALCAYFLIHYSGSSSATIATLEASSSGTINKVILPDGTLVWLKGNSTLEYPSKFTGHTRNVSLKGEALFEVAKDAQHPFIISCGDLRTTVLGTSFNIKSVDEKIEVVVLTGKVSLTSAKNKESVIVMPNEKVIYDGKKQALAAKEPVKEEKLETVMGTNYLMAFEDSRMNEVIQRIQEKFDVIVTVSDAKLGNCLITADFSDQSLESTLSMISQALNFEYSINGKSIVLSGKGCE